ncbi:hypothetical protein [Microcoleus sp. S13_C5]
MTLRRDIRQVIQTIGAQSMGQVPVSRVALSPRNYLRFEIYSTDESGSLN